MSETHLMVPFEHPVAGTVRVPGSKSLTNRALVLAALARGKESGQENSVLEHALQSEDTEIMVDCLQRLGIGLQTDWPSRRVTIAGCGGRIPATRADLFVGNSGTTMRFLTAILGAARGRYRLDGIERMRERPIGDLLAALAQLGVQTKCERHEGYPPVIMETNGLHGGLVRVCGSLSSQFVSGLLIAAPLAEGDIVLELEGDLVSRPYVDMTVRIMKHFGASVETDGVGHYRVHGRQRYQPRCYVIEPDASAASYFFAAAALTGGCVTVPDLDRGSLQGDVRFVDLLAEMGAKLESGAEGLTVRGGGLHGIAADMNDISDCVMTLAAVACFAEGATTIRKVAHVRHKESDRLHALATELRRIGALVQEFDDGLRIEPRPLHGAVMETYGDHRLAMSWALIGLRVPGISIRDPGCVAKTYPNFFADLERLRL
jgi:3-phosphoshikimate 1-carboxyvinyltransferase